MDLSLFIFSFTEKFLQIRILQQRTKCGFQISTEETYSKESRNWSCLRGATFEVGHWQHILCVGGKDWVFHLHHQEEMRWMSTVSMVQTRVGIQVNNPVQKKRW